MVEVESSREWEATGKPRQTMQGLADQMMCPRAIGSTPFAHLLKKWYGFLIIIPHEVHISTSI